MLPACLFDIKLSRTELLALPKPENPKILRLLVLRNHAFEYVASLLNIFLGQIGLQALYSYSDYDDSLNFPKNFFEREHDAVLLWIDATRYTIPDFCLWLKTRLSVICALTKTPILVFVFGKKILENLNQGSILAINVDKILASLGDKAFDARLAPLSGTLLSAKAILEMARNIALTILPKFFLQPLKAIILDCDETLYKGVLEEEGINGVTPFIQLQTYLKKLKEEGFLLCLSSKNEEYALKQLFEERNDFPLRWSDFAKIKINWKKKSENIREIAKEINIGEDALLFIDDNLGELLDVSNALPSVHLLPAGSEDETLHRLRYYPFLQKKETNFEDIIRTKDILANQKRNALHMNLSKDEYRRTLKIHLTIFINPIEQINRITELLNKTNQFIFCYLRPTLNDVETFLTQKEKVCITCAMEDALSKSGIIACGLFTKKDDLLRVSELTVSCRALGRDVETGLLFYLLNLACKNLSAKKIELPFKKGPKNKPALQWLENKWPGSIFHEKAIANMLALTDDLNDIQIEIIE